MIHNFFFFSASCLEEATINFKSLHPEITNMKLWSDNGPHYKNTSLVIWLASFKSLPGTQLDNFSNFEPQKGKTKLNSHYATLKFSRRSYRHESHNIESSEDIIAGTEGILRGTHVFYIFIDRQKEPKPAKTLTGIRIYSDFEYVYNKEGSCCSGSKHD